MTGEIGQRGAQVIEPYLDDRSEVVGTRLKIMCRLGCLPTMTRVVREEKLPPEQGYCRLCGEGDEDVRHLLVTCSAHDRHRSKMFRVVESALLASGEACLGGRSKNDQTDVLLGKKHWCCKG